jgi:beta-glucanase (GH16 family)
MTAHGRLLGAATALTLLAVVSGCAVPSTAPSPAATQAEKLIWSDEFDGAAGTSPDAANWNFVTGGDGSGNNELQCYTTAPGNVSLDGSGDLVITAIRQPGHICADGKKNDYTSARLTTANKFTTKYGRMEVRAKVPTSSGSWPAFWALGANKPTVGWPEAGEIDVMEVVGKQPSVVHGTLHGPKADGTPTSVSTSIDTGSDLAGTFHVFGAEWTPTQITFTLDGKAYGTVSKDTFEKAGGKWVFTQSFYLLLNLAVGGDFPGNPVDGSPWPQSYTIDYVRVYN